MTQLVITQKVIPGSITGFKDGVFKMPVVIELHYTDGSVVRQTVNVEHATEIVKVPKGAGPQGGVPKGVTRCWRSRCFDPGSRILKTVSFAKPAAMLKAQAMGAAAMLDRYDALVAMKGLPMAQKAGLLAQVFNKEKCFATRVEALNQLAADSCGVCGDVVKAALTDTDVAVRKAALAGLDAHSARALTMLPLVEGLLKDSSYDIVDVALQKLADANPAKLPDYLALTKGIEGNIGRNVKVRWLELAWLSGGAGDGAGKPGYAGGKREYADELVQMASQSYEFRTRVNAMAALKRMDYFSEALTGFLVDAILSPNTRLAGPAGELLGYFYGQDRYRPVIGAFVRAGKWAPWQQGSLGGFAR